MNHHSDLRSLRALLAEKAKTAPGSMAPMFDRMIAVMDNFVPQKLAGRRYLALSPKKPTAIRKLQRQVSETIDDIYGLRNTPHTIPGLLPMPTKPVSPWMRGGR